MNPKESDSLKMIERTMKSASSPVILCSFGKDSLVMLHLIRKIGLIPAVHWRENSQFQKYDFANKVIKEYGLTVYDYPPSANDIIYHKGHFDGLSFNQVGNAFWYVAIELTKTQGKYFSCSLKEILRKPVIPHYSYPWDVSFMGLKETDKDPILGRMKLNTYEFQLGSTKVILPLKDWTDEDIWDYIFGHRLPLDERRYDVAGNCKELPDKEFNNNYHFSCTDCINPEMPLRVYCPVLKGEIENRGSKINYAKKIENYKKMVSYVDWEVQDG